MANPVLSDALTEAGVTYRKLDYWATLGLVCPQGGGGSGNRRQWPEEELEIARRIGILTRSGLTLARAAEVARQDDWAACIPGMGRHPAGSASEWQARARCAETDSEVFFPEKGGSNKPAKAICKGCEVRAECLDSAIADEITWGVWGGLTYLERLRVAAARRREEKVS